MHTLDTRQLRCPQPLLALQRLAKQLQHGEVITIYCRDQGTLSDTQAWCEVHQHEFISHMPCKTNEPDTSHQPGDYIMMVRI